MARGITVLVFLAAIALFVFVSRNEELVPVFQTGLSPSEEEVGPEGLADAELLNNLALFESGGPVPPEKDPLDAAFFDLPERLLDEDKDVFDQIKATADRLLELYDGITGGDGLPPAALQ